MDDKCVFTMCQIGSSRHLFALGTLPCLCFFPPHKQHSDDILQDGIKTQYAVLWGEKHAAWTANIDAVEEKKLLLFP